MINDSTTLIALDSFIETNQVNIRNELVIIDYDIIKLFEIDIEKLYKLIKSNKTRFPSDFVFSLTEKEKQKYKNAKYAFTYSGILMLSGLINTERGIKISIQLTELFIRRFPGKIFELL